MKKHIFLLFWLGIVSTICSAQTLTFSSPLVLSGTNVSIGLGTGTNEVLQASDITIGTNWSNYVYFSGGVLNTSNALNGTGSLVAIDSAGDIALLGSTDTGNNSIAIGAGTIAKNSAIVIGTYSTTSNTSVSAPIVIGSHDLGEWGGLAIGAYETTCYGYGSAVGIGVVVGQGGGAIGSSDPVDACYTYSGGSVGFDAYSSNGGAVGQSAATTNGGAVGYGAYSISGGAIGSGAEATSGFAGGFLSQETSGGGAIGQNTYAGSGGAIGLDASAITGGAVGGGATATSGFAGGLNASALYGGVELGTGTNITTNLAYFGNSIATTNGQIMATTGLLDSTSSPGTSNQVLSSTVSGTLWVNPANGTVTSVGLSMPSQFTVTNSPVTGTGTLTVTLTNSTGSGPIVESTNPTINGATLTGTNNVTGTLELSGLTAGAALVLTSSNNVTSTNMTGAITSTNGISNTTVGFLSGSLSGTAYTITTNDAEITGGTTSPTITLSAAGTYFIVANVSFGYSNATYSSQQFIYCYCYRTNNTPGAAGPAESSGLAPNLTNYTANYGQDVLIGTYTTTNTNDTLAIYGMVTHNPTTGSVIIPAATIYAIQLK